MDRPGRIFVQRPDQMSAEDRTLLQTVARVIVDDGAGTLADQVERRGRLEPRVPRFLQRRNDRPETTLAALTPRRDLSYFNGFGGFTRDGHEYVIMIAPGRVTPAPWVNVLANPFFGTVVSESGGAYTWCENAHEMRLTPWYNDPVSDASGEALYVRDEESGRFWSPTPLPARGHTLRQPARFRLQRLRARREWHRLGAVDIRGHGRAGEIRGAQAPQRVGTSATSLRDRLLRVGAGRPPPQIAHVRHDGGRPQDGRRLRSQSELHGPRRPRRLPRRERCRAKRHRRPGRVSRPERHDRESRRHDASPPLWPRRRRVDPCAATQVQFDLAAGQEREVCFTLGIGRDADDARNLIQRFRGSIPARRSSSRYGNIGTTPWGRSTSTRPTPP